MHIYYPPTSSTGQPIETLYNNPVSGECVLGDVSNTVAMEGNDESNDEIKRCEYLRVYLSVSAPINVDHKFQVHARTRVVQETHCGVHR